MNFALKPLATAGTFVFVLASSSNLMAWDGYSMSNSFGGHNYYNSNGTSAGYSMSNSFGGHNYYNSNGTSAGYSMSNSFGGHNYYRGNSKEIESKIFSDKDIANKIDITILQDAFVSRNVDAMTSCAWDLKGVELILGKKDKTTTSDMLFAAAAKIAVEQGNGVALKQIIALAPECKKYEEQLALKGQTRGMTKSVTALPQLTYLPQKDWEKALSSLQPWEQPALGDYMLLPSFRGMTKQSASTASMLINTGRVSQNPQMIAMGALELSKYSYDNKLGAKFEPAQILAEAAELAILQQDKVALSQIIALYEIANFKTADYAKYLQGELAMLGDKRGMKASGAQCKPGDFCPVTFLKEISEL